jgi:hypothetical protein
MLYIYVLFSSLTASSVICSLCWSCVSVRVQHFLPLACQHSMQAGKGSGSGSTETVPTPRICAPPNSDSRSRKRALELFAGSGVWGQQMSKFGWFVEAYDIKYDSSHDILRPGEEERLCQLVADHHFKAILIATECTTFSQAAKPPYRTKEHILGLPDLPVHKHQKVLEANSMAVITAHVMQAAQRVGIACFCENPWSSMLWKQPDIGQLLLGPDNAWSIHRVDYCQWGAQWQKKTGIMSNRPYVNELSRLCKCKSAHEVTLEGSLCKKANRYPERLVGTSGLRDLPTANMFSRV